MMYPNVRHKLLTLLLLTLNTASANRYAIYDYDLTTPQFTPDGRLLQVEYATNACVRDGSCPILSVGIGGEDGILVMGTVSGDLIPDSDGEGDNNVGARVNHLRTQYRIIEVPISSHYTRIKDATAERDLSAITTSTILIGLSGHLSDATSLLQTIYAQLEEEQSVFGWHRLGVSPMGQDLEGVSSQMGSVSLSETAVRLSRTAADTCQKHAFGGGLRPIGASLLVSAIDGHDSGRVAMCKTDPSGSLESLVSTTPQIMISGGSIKSQSKLHDLIESRLKDVLFGGDKLNAEHRTRKVLQAVIMSLVDEWKSRQSTQLPLSKDRRIESVPESNISQSRLQLLPRMEVVFVSPKMGTFRLSDDDISTLLKDDV